MNKHINQGFGGSEANPRVHVENLQNSIQTVLGAQDQTGNP